MFLRGRSDWYRKIMALFPSFQLQFSLKSPSRSLIGQHSFNNQPSNHHGAVKTTSWVLWTTAPLAAIWFCGVDPDPARLRRLKKRQWIGVCRCRNWSSVQQNRSGQGEADGPLFRDSLDAQRNTSRIISHRNVYRHTALRVRRRFIQVRIYFLLRRHVVRFD